jgi:hypothetical protein
LDALQEVASAMMDITVGLAVCVVSDTKSDVTAIFWSSQTEGIDEWVAAASKGLGFEVPVKTTVKVEVSEVDVEVEKPVLHAKADPLPAQDEGRHHVAGV